MQMHADIAVELIKGAPGYCGYHKFVVADF
jgi:hypothetical protein